MASCECGHLFGNFYEGMTGENKATTDPLINPYVSSVLFRNIQPVCKITKADGTLLSRDSEKL